MLWKHIQSLHIRYALNNSVFKLNRNRELKGEGGQISKGGSHRSSLFKSNFAVCLQWNRMLRGLRQSSYIDQFMCVCGGVYWCSFLFVCLFEAVSSTQKAEASRSVWAEANLVEFQNSQDYVDISCLKKQEKTTTKRGSLYLVFAVLELAM